MILKVSLYLSALTLILSDGGCRNCSYFVKDCQKVFPKCIWNSKSQCQENNGTLNKESNLNTISMETTNYCSQFSIRSCNLQYGCAFYAEKCTLFLGCDAYTGFSNEQCFNVSFICTYASGNTCSRNLNYDTNGSPNVTLACSDAPYYYHNLVDKCKYYSPKCLYDGFTCVDELKNCDQQNFNNNSQCSKLIGLDGHCTNESLTNCQLQPCSLVPKSECNRKDCFLNGTNCIQRKKCQGSANSLSDCNFTESCYFDGTQCTPIQRTCSDYRVDTCKGKYGIDGLCVVDNNQCRRQSCYKSNYIDTISKFYCQTLNLCVDKTCSFLNENDCQSNSDCYFDSITLKCMQSLDPCESHSYNECPQNCQSSQLTINKQECMNSLSESECRWNTQFDSNIPCYWDDDLQICQQATQCEQLIAVNDQICKKFSSSCYYDSTSLTCTDVKWLECQQRKTENYCTMGNNCYWAAIAKICVPAYFDCENIKNQNECFVNLYQYPCVWNQTTAKCLRYHERDPYISQYTCESISNKWVYEGICQLKKKCYELNFTGIGFEGNCSIIYDNSIQNCPQIIDSNKCFQSNLKCQWNNSTSTCNLISSCLNLDQKYCKKYSDQCIYKTSCLPKVCSDQINQCQSIQGFTLDTYMYCKSIGGKCYQVPPENETDCFLYSQGYSYDEGACELCDQNQDFSTQRFLIKNYTMIDIESQNFGQLLSLIFIIFINL